jgi:hypothetical protein
MRERRRGTLPPVVTSCLSDPGLCLWKCSHFERAAPALGDTEAVLVCGVCQGGWHNSRMHKLKIRSKHSDVMVLITGD